MPIPQFLRVVMRDKDIPRRKDKHVQGLILISHTIGSQNSSETTHRYTNHHKSQAPKNDMDAPLSILFGHVWSVFIPGLGESCLVAQI